jgi:predicted nucleotidyltransferase
MKTLETIKETLQQALPDLQHHYGVTSLGIFGSYVRGEQTPNSDIDLLIEFDPNHRIGLFKFCELENYLSDSLGIQVDLVEKSALKPTLGTRILQELQLL